MLIAKTQKTNSLIEQDTWTERIVPPSIVYHSSVPTTAHIQLFSVLKYPLNGVVLSPCRLLGVTGEPHIVLKLLASES